MNNNLIFTKTISSVIKLPGIAYSNSIYEPRIRVYKDYSNTFYPTQKRIDYLDFIYEK